MSKATLTTAAAIGVIGALMTSQARAESAGGTDAEIALLKKQLQLLEQKLDKLQKQTAANTTAAANANAKAKADVQRHRRQRSLPSQGTGGVGRCRRPHDEQSADDLHRR